MSEGRVPDCRRGRVCFRAARFLNAPSAKFYKARVRLCRELLQQFRFNVADKIFNNLCAEKKPYNSAAAKIFEAPIIEAFRIVPNSLVVRVIEICSQRHGSAISQ